jgi:4'-phosphopantetheinyl transferase
VSERPRVDVWTARLDSLPVAPGAARVLSAAELERAGRLKRPADRRRAIVRWTLLRRLLSEYAGLPPAALPLVAEPGGKPRLALDLGLEFSVSHRGGLAVYAVCWHGPVGVDVERPAPVAEADEIVTSQFAAVEAERYAALPPARRAAAFVDLWTAKEAYAKGTGEGIGAGLDRFAVLGGRVWRLDGVPHEPWFVRRLWVDGHRAAVACTGAPPVIVRRRLDRRAAQASQKQQPMEAACAAPIRPAPAAGAARSMLPP